jgi:hypothetical protein
MVAPKSCERFDSTRSGTSDPTCLETLELTEGSQYHPRGGGASQEAFGSFTKSNTGRRDSFFRFIVTQWDDLRVITVIAQRFRLWIIVFVASCGHPFVISAGALSLRGGNPVFGQFDKLIPHIQVICQSSKAHTFSGVAHVFLVGVQRLAPGATCWGATMIASAMAKGNLPLAAG